MNISSKFYMSTFNFDVTLKSLLIGYSRKEIATETGCTNVVVFGTTVASARAYVDNILKGATTDNIRCAGVDAKESDFRGRGFTGYIVMLPELQYISAEHFDRITDVYRVLTDANVGKDATGQYKDLDILFANRDIEASFYGSIFEKWKTEKTTENDWYIYGERPRFSRAWGSISESIRKNDYYEDTVREIGDSLPPANAKDHMVMAPPYVLSWVKVAEKLLAKGCEQNIVTDQILHPVRFGPQFLALAPHVVYEAIRKFSTSAMRGASNRILVIHDSVALEIFKARVTNDIAVGTTYGTACGSSGTEPEKVIVSPEDLQV